MQADPGLPWLLIILGAVVLFNVGLLYALMTGALQNQLDMLSKAFHRSRNPWQDEDEALAELRRRVEDLNSSPGQAGEERE